MRSRGRGRSRGLRAAVLGTLAAVSLALLPACGQGRPWAEDAVQWVEARDRAVHRSVADLLMFESPDTVHLLCCSQAGPLEGRAALGSLVAANFGESLDEETMGRAFIDVSGAVVEYRFQVDPGDEEPSGGGYPVPGNEVQVSENAADGAATQTIHAQSLRFLLTPYDDGRTGYGEDPGAAHFLTERYLSAWSGRDGRAVGDLYAEDATVLDSLLGVRLTGRDAIGSYAAEHGGARLREDSIPDRGGPALYGYWREYESHLTAYLIYTGDDGNHCPGGVTAALKIEQGQIVAERRYHDVASMRRCVDGAELPDGWWTHAVIPAPIHDRVTGTVTAAGQRIEVHNGTVAANDLVSWAMARFPAADLTAPIVTSVAFSEEASLVQCSDPDLRGLALRLGSDTRIFLCLSFSFSAPPAAQELMLHELAHVWMWMWLTEPIQDQFLARMHLPTWDSTDVPWEQRGSEHAAAVIAWGLADEPLSSRLLASRSCADLAGTFVLLTGAAPQRPPCPPNQ